jgi:diadenosine tetraphosphate (Ap4A) HIT family hydrolase
MAMGKQPLGSGMCALCRTVVDATERPDAFLCNTRLMETPEFIVIPSLGPLVPGHVMAVSKVHCESLASMGQDGLREYEALAVRLRDAPLLRDNDPLEAEHGSTANDKAGACVVHTHVHWLPGMGQFLDEFRKRLPLRTEASLRELTGRQEPYIFLRNGRGHAILDARGLPSQMIRRVLCDILDRDDTDWTQALRMNWVEETVAAWQGYSSSV